MFCLVASCIVSASVIISHVSNVNNFQTSEIIYLYFLCHSQTVSFSNGNGEIESICFFSPQKKKRAALLRGGVFVINCCWGASYKILHF